MKKRIVATLVSTMMASTCLLTAYGAEGAENGEETVKLSVWAFGNTSDLWGDPGETSYWQTIQEKCNVELTFLDNSGGSEAMSLLIGTDDLPDIIIDYNGTFPGGVQKMLADELIIPLNDLMDQGYMPNLVAYLETDPIVNQVVKNDAGLYAWAPMIREDGATQVFNGHHIRKDWLDALGLEVPDSLEEMEEVLLAFKENYDSVGYSTYKDSYTRELIIQAFGVRDGMYVDTRDNTVHYGPLEEGYEDAMELFQKWQNLGIIDPDSFTQDSNAIMAKAASDKTGFFFGWGSFGTLEKLKEEHPGMEWIAGAHPTAVEGEEYIVNRGGGYRVDELGGAIAASCEYPERAARVLDYLYSEEGYVLGNFGVEGITYELVDGNYEMTEFVTNNPDGLTSQEALSLYAGNGNKPYVVSKYANQPTVEATRYAYEVWATPNDIIKNMPPESLTDAEAKEYSSIMTDINTYKDEMIMKFMLGTEPIENYPKFIENLKGMNIERAIEIKQAEYDRFLAR